MFFQRFLKGISKLSAAEATEILTETGILSRWLSTMGTPAGKDIQDRLTWHNLDWHLNHYDEPDPLMGYLPFCERTPFISTTAGTVERDLSVRQNFIKSAFRTALNFATQGFTTTGYVFYGYVYVLGKKSIALEAFAEEVRDLHTYTGFLPYHHEGEIAAKLRIPAVNLERCEEYDGRTALHQLANAVVPIPNAVILNPRFAPPENYLNLRDALD